MKPLATRKNNFYPYLLLFIQPIFMASNIIVARGGVEYVPPVSLAFWRWLTVFVILIPFFFDEIIKTVNHLQKARDIGGTYSTPPLATIILDAIKIG